MRRHIADWSISELCKVITKDGLAGWGETIPHYTWGVVTDESVDRVIGRNPSGLLWDDTLGAGLQQAMFDLVVKKLGVPAHRLIGPQVRERCPIAWWCWDMSAEAWVDETRHALDAGYPSFKLKAWPGHDLFAATEAISQATPDHCAFDLDFNSLLVTDGLPQQLLPRLEAIPKVHFVETPIPRRMCMAITSFDQSFVCPSPCILTTRLF
jgi:L-alanine-DL-glutamate epimerase-like enolase superfamily enzyme